MEGHHIKSLMEAYSSIYNDAEELYLVEDNLGEEVEILNEGIFGSQDPKSGVVGQVQRLGAKMFGDASAVNRATSYERSVNDLSGGRRGAGNVPLGKDGKPLTAAQIAAETKRRRLADPNYKAGQGVDSGAKPSLNKPAPKDDKNKGGGGGGGGGGSRTPVAPASQTVLAKKGGVEGKLDKATGKFTAGNFSDAEKARYNKAATQKNNAAANANYQKDRAAISTAKTPEAKAAATKKAEKTGMDAWAKANPTLANKKKTPNPLMKDMPGQNKAELEKLRGNAAINSISKSPSAKKILNTSKIGQASLNRSEFGSATKPAATTPKPAAAAPKPAATTPKPAPAKRETQLFHTDLFDIVKGHLLDEGYADSEEAAMVIMVNMSEEWRDEIVELYKGKHGQSEEEYMDSRSDAGKQISGDSKQSGAAYSHRSFKGQGKPAKPGERQTAQGKMTNADRTELMIRKNALRKEAEAKALKKEEQTHLEGDQIDEFFGPKTVTPKDSPSGTKSVQVGKKYPAQLNGRMVNVQYDKSGNKSTKEMTGMERGIQALKMRNTGHSSMSPRP